VGEAEEANNEKNKLFKFHPNASEANYELLPLVCVCVYCMYASCALLASSKQSNSLLCVCVCVAKGAGLRCVCLAAPRVCIYIICHSPAVAFIRPLRGLI
jgi:hypothetical protein